MEPISLICAVKRGRTDAEGESEVVLTIPLSSMPAYLRLMMEGRQKALEATFTEEKLEF